MHVFRMKGAWDPLHVRAWELFISRRIAPIYDRLGDGLTPRLPKRGRVLDVGCGTGRTVGVLARRLPEVEFTGVDLSPAMISLAWEQARGLRNVFFRPGDAQNLPFDDGAFDAALSVASIKHWPDPALGVREMARVVRPGGLVFVLEVDPECSRERTERFVGRWLAPPLVRPLLVEYFRRFVAAQGIPRQSLRRMAEDAGLRDVADASDAAEPAIWITGVRPGG